MVQRTDDNVNKCLVMLQSTVDDAYIWIGPSVSSHNFEYTLHLSTRKNPAADRRYKTPQSQSITWSTHKTIQSTWHKQNKHWRHQHVLTISWSK